MNDCDQRTIRSLIETKIQRCVVFRGPQFGLKPAGRYRQMAGIIPFSAETVEIESREFSRGTYSAGSLALPGFDIGVKYVDNALVVVRALFQRNAERRLRYIMNVKTTVKTIPAAPAARVARTE